MSDYIQVSCPKCETRLRVRQEYVGRKVACKHCAESFVIEAAASEPFVPQPTPAPDDRLERENAALRSDLDGLRANQKRLQGELDEIGRRREKDHANHKAELNRLKESADAANHERESERQSALAEWEQRLRDLRDESQGLRANHEAELNRLKESADAASRERESERQTILAEWERRLSDSRDESQGLRTEIERRESETVEARRKLEESNARFESDRAAIKGELSQSGDELAAVRDDLTRVRDENGRLEEVLRTLRTSLDALKNEHLAEVSQLASERDEVRSRYDAEFAKSKTLEQRIEEALSDLDGERRQREEEARAHGETFTQTRADWEGERGRLTDTFHAAETKWEAEVSALRQDLAAQSDRSERLATEVQEAAEARARLESELSNRHQQIEELKASLSEAQDFKHQIKTFLSGLGIRLPG